MFTTQQMSPATKVNNVPTMIQIPTFPIVADDCRSSGADVLFRTEEESEVFTTVSSSFISSILCMSKSLEDMLAVEGQTQRQFPGLCSVVVVDVGRLGEVEESVSVVVKVIQG